VHTWSRTIISEKDLEARRIAAKRQGIEPQLDSTIEDLRSAMKESNIEKAVILPIDSGLNQRMPLTLKEKTDWHADEVKGDPDIITCVGLDPRRGEEGLVELQRAVQEKDCRGWKMYPPNGFYPDEDRFYPYYEFCTEHNIPIIIHTGFTSRFKHVKYAKPVYVDKVAADFPSLKIILAHAGTPWENEALMVAAKNPNISIDLSGWQIYASRVPMKLYQLIADAKLARVFPSRVIWGSDFPLFEQTMKLKDWAAFFTTFRLPESLVEMGYQQVTDDELEQCMWTNAERLFFGGKP
jgi:hypothetical protein